MATIKQIAEMAGVSRGTVDRVLNNRGSVNANTAARVREIAEKLNYKPNKAGLMPKPYQAGTACGILPMRMKSSWKIPSVIRLPLH